MALHTVTGRWKLGLLLAFSTALIWGTLPVALKLVLNVLDPYTVTWFRFAFAAVVLGLWLASRGGFTQFRGLSARHLGWLLLAASGLIGNYVFYVLGLFHTTPANAQLLIQLAPLLMALGGIVVFGERFRWGQWLGLAAVVLGMLLFFSDQLQRSSSGDDYSLGVLFILIAAVVWAAYALIQKQLLLRLSSPAVLWSIYAIAGVVLLPTASLQALSLLTPGQWAVLIYCACTTLAAYGAFAEALAHWEASRVSVVLALTPLLTVLSVELAHWFAPGLVQPESIGLVGFVGALVVVSGSAATSLLGQRRRTG